MSKAVKFGIILIFCVATFALAVGVGSVSVSLSDTLKILGLKLFGISPAAMPDEITISILWKIRLPRVLLAFMVGSAISVSGVIMQSILRNPLASSYTMGVSSGAAMGASFAILLGISIFGRITLPVFGLTFGLLTVFLAVGIASRLDRNMENATIILTGMAFSLFANAVITLMMSLARQELQILIFWQMGSFALKDWSHPAILLPVAIFAVLIPMWFSRDMDIMTFGEEQAKIAGVELKKVKWILLSTGAIATGSAVALVGIIGFVDLFTPHVARRIFGAQHRHTIPASALLGGSFMMLCDLFSRVVLSPVELPVGAITSLIGAPFFMYLFFSKRVR